MQNLQGLAFLAPVTHSEEYPEVRRGPHPLVQNEIRKTLAGPVLVAREEMLLAYAGKRAEALADPDLLRGSAWELDCQEALIRHWKSGSNQALLALKKQVGLLRDGAGSS